MSCQQPETDAEVAGDQQMMDSLMTAYEEAWETPDRAAFDEILAPGFSRTTNNGESYGIDSLKQIATGEGGLQNVNIELGESIYGANTAAVSWTLNATMGGQSISTAGASFVTFEDGMIASERVYGYHADGASHDAGWRRRQCGRGHVRDVESDCTC